MADKKARDTDGGKVGDLVAAMSGGAVAAAHHGNPRAPAAGTADASSPQTGAHS